MRVGIIGGGAAGFFGAIACAEMYPEATVTLFEAGQRPLAKVLISGGGRCNVTHACFEPAALVQNYPRGGKALRGALTRFQPRNTVQWFERRGVRLKVEADGRMFPVTDDSATIANCLTQAAMQAGVKLRTQAAVAAIERNGDDFLLRLRSGQVVTCDRILIATGSNPRGYQFAQSLGHTIQPPVPSLFTFNIADPKLRELAGIAIEPVEVKLSIPSQKSKQKPLQQSGAVLITHWGLSGPAILKLSAWGARVLHDQRYQAQLSVNWLPEQNPEQLRQVLIEAKVQMAKRAIANYCPVDLPRRFWRYILSRAEIDPQQNWAEQSKKAINRLVQELSQGQFQIQGKGVFKDEFVTCGGVSLKEVDFKTMQSRLCPGLYFAGEVLDIDGVTGGFNFQSAWTTGWISGQSMGCP
ncbi:MAG: NAD(P)/FAD-dependent oxidoreductase [Thainema sp.]